MDYELLVNLFHVANRFVDVVIFQAELYTALLLPAVVEFLDAVRPGCEVVADAALAQSIGDINGRLPSRRYIMPWNAHAGIVIIDIVQLHKLIAGKKRGRRNINDRHDGTGNLFGAERAGKKARMPI